MGGPTTLAHGVRIWPASLPVLLLRTVDALTTERTIAADVRVDKAALDHDAN